MCEFQTVSNETFLNKHSNPCYQIEAIETVADSIQTSINGAILIVNLFSFFPLPQSTPISIKAPQSQSFLLLHRNRPVTIKTQKKTIHHQNANPHEQKNHQLNLQHQQPIILCNPCAPLNQCHCTLKTLLWNYNDHGSRAEQGATRTSTTVIWGIASSPQSQHRGPVTRLHPLTGERSTKSAPAKPTNPSSSEAKTPVNPSPPLCVPPSPIDPNPIPCFNGVLVRLCYHCRYTHARAKPPQT